MNIAKQNGVGVLDTTLSMVEKIFDPELNKKILDKLTDEPNILKAQKERNHFVIICIFILCSYKTIKNFINVKYKHAQ